jgi:hypothetical protein
VELFEPFAPGAGRRGGAFDPYDEGIGYGSARHDEGGLDHGSRSDDDRGTQPPGLCGGALRYWTKRDRESAGRIATTAVVTALFRYVWHESGGWTARGCQRAAGSTTCTFARPRRHLVMQVRDATGVVPLQVVSLQMQTVK